MVRTGWLFLVTVGLALAGCGEAEAPSPVVAGEEGSPATRGSGRADPLEPQAAGQGRHATPSEPEAAPEGETGSGQLSLEPRGEETGVPYAVYSWGTQEQGVHTLLRLTTRPKGTGEWPWFTVEAWIRAPRGLEEWVGREIAIHRFEYLPGPGLAPWGAGGRAFLVLREVQPGRLRVDVDLELKDPLDGTAQRLRGRLLAVEARR